MSVVLELIKYVLPALIVLATVYLMLKEFFKKETQIRILAARADNRKAINPLRIQAYERLTLFLERIVPENLILRSSSAGINATQLKLKLINNIRDEFDHNLSQQIYISSEAWELIRNAKEEMINLINASGTEINEKSGPAELSKNIFGKYLSLKNSPVKKALEALKKELRQEF
jgi:hypothetical protein